MRRTPTQVAADKASAALAVKLGRMLRDGRHRMALKQTDAAERAGLSQSEWSELERGTTRATIPTLNRAAFAVGGDLDAFIRQMSAANLPHDAVHLRNQEQVIRDSVPGGWQALPEESIDRDARTSRAADVLLTRKREGQPREYALWDIRDWIDDAGGVVRDFSRRLDAVERHAIARMSGDDPLPRTGGCMVLRATRRNRLLVADHRHFFGSRFPGSGHAWLAALRNLAAPLPHEPALAWVSVDGERLFPAKFALPRPVDSRP